MAISITVFTELVDETYDDYLDLQELPLASNFVTFNPNWPHPEESTFDYSDAEELQF